MAATYAIFFISRVFLASSSSWPVSCMLRAVNLHVSHEFSGEKLLVLRKSTIVDSIVFSILRTNPRSFTMRETSIQVFYRLFLNVYRLPSSSRSILINTTVEFSKLLVLLGSITKLEILPTYFLLYHPD